MSIERPIASVKTGDTSIKSSNNGLDGGTIHVNHADPARQVPRELIDDSEFSDVERSAEELAGRKKIDDFFALPEKERVAKIATILDRGIIHDRLKVPLPNDLHGEWVRNDPLEIARMQTLGFWVDNTYATRRSLHSDGSSANIVGDVIHVVTMRANKEMIDRVRAEQSRAQTSGRKKKEDTEFLANTERDTGGIIPAFSESNERSVNANDVRAALSRADAQTGVQK